MISFSQYVAEQSVTGGFNIPRSQMPQIADQEAFSSYLVFAGVKVNKTTVNVAMLRPTQTEFDPEKVAAMSPPYSPVIMSNDGYVLDGHHRYFAALRDSAALPVGGLNTIEAYVCYTPINQLLKHANEFCNE